MTLTRKVNGKSIPLTADEIADIEIEWAENDAKAADRAAERLTEQAKKQRDLLVQDLKVTTSYGTEFNANDFSQNKMNAAITVLDDGEFTEWKLSNNTWQLISKGELKEALKLAAEAQTIIWKG